MNLFSSRVPALPDPLHHGHLTIGSSSAAAAGSVSGHLLSSSSPARVSSAQLNSHPQAGTAGRMVLLRLRQPFLPHQGLVMRLPV